MMKSFLVLAVCVLCVIADSMACSIQVDANAQKNLLAALGASHLDISLAQVRSTAIADYSMTTSGSDGVSCPDYLHTQATVSFEYKPAANENCSAQVTIYRSQFVGEVLTGPIESVEYADLTAACSTTVAGRRIIKVPQQRPIKIPVRVVRPPRP